MKRNISVFSLAMVIFIAVFGFGNIPNNYAAFGPSSFSWFLLLGIYFIPVALMIAEMATANKDSSSGISAWIKTTLGERAAFFAAWTYFIGNIFYLPTLFSRIPVYISWIFAKYSYEEVNSMDTKPINGIISATDDKLLFVSLIFVMVVLVTVLALTQEKIFEKFSRITGILSMIIAGIFIVLAFSSVLFLNTQPAIEFSASNFKPSFDPMVWSSIAWLIFAIAGVETIGAFSNQVDNPVKKIPKAVIISAIIVVIGYSIGTLSLTFIATPDQLPSGSLEQLLPMMYGRLFADYGLGTWALRLTMLSYLILTTVAAVLWSLANIKVFLSESPKFLASEKMLSVNKFGTPTRGLVFQSILIVLFVVIINFGGNSLGNIYFTFYDMSTMAIIVPLIVLFIAYIMYRVKNIDAPFKMVKSNSLAIIIAMFVVIVTTFGFVAVGWDFSYLSGGDIADTISQAKLYFGGLGFFLIIGLIWYEVTRSLSKKKG